MRGVCQESRQREGKPEAESMQLMEKVVARENMLCAYKQVMRNKGAAGIDSIRVEELLPHLQKH
jgi:hypothetical protein